MNKIVNRTKEVLPIKWPVLNGDTVNGWIEHIRPTETQSTNHSRSSQTSPQTIEPCFKILRVNLPLAVSKRLAISLVAPTRHNSSSDLHISIHNISYTEIDSDQKRCLWNLIVRLWRKTEGRCLLCSCVVFYWSVAWFRPFTLLPTLWVN